jgi:NAD(P)-dependent dehydrogenase (short-subunit alcohol dehydrogenase family)
LPRRGSCAVDDPSDGGAADIAPSASGSSRRWPLSQVANGLFEPGGSTWYNRCMTQLFPGKIALVTGAASGIGAGAVERLRAEGAIVVAADVNASGLDRVAAATGAEPMLLDVTSAEAWQIVVENIVARHGRIDIAFLNAGIMTRPPGANLFTDVSDALTEEGYRRITSVNIDGVVLGAMAVLPAMEAGGDIVMTASIAGLVPFTDDPFYGLTKHAVVGFGRALGPALASRGVRVNVLCPGATDTAILAPDQKASRNVWGPPSFIADALVGILAAGGNGEVWVAYRAGHKPWRYEFAPSQTRHVATEAVPIFISTDVAAALGRYRSLGFEATAYGDESDNPEYGFMKYGSANFHIARATSNDPLTSNIAAYLYVADAVATHRAWSSSGVEGRFVAPVDTAYGLSEGAYIDPDGNLIRFGSSTT